MAEDERASLYRLILRRTSDAVLLDCMRVHGFWPYSEGLPPDPAEEVTERLELGRQKAALLPVATGVADPEAALAAERKRRWEESKKRRAQRKAERLAREAERREAFAKASREGTVYLGDGVSGGLDHTESEVALLESQDLPVLHTASDLALALGVEIGTLRWLTYHRVAVTLVHYHRYEIPKKSGGWRAISAPKTQLANAQQWVLEHILRPLPVEPMAHGFVEHRSIATNASPHVGRKLVINLDLKDFFPTVSLPRVRGLFRKLGYSGQVAALLALLCTEPPRVPAELDGKIYHVALGDRRLPQGACTSPAITNLICRRLDRRLHGLAFRYQFRYTRYADDLTFSGDDATHLGALFRFVRAIIKAEGFRENTDKTRIMRPGRRQEVSGVVVNDRRSISRQDRRRLRAILHNVARDGLKAQNRDGHPDFAQYLRGLLSFYSMVDGPGSEPLKVALEKALR